MKNIEVKIEKDTLILKVDLKKTFGASKTGKSIIIASTEGNVAVGQDVYLGVNVYKKA